MKIFPKTLWVIDSETFEILLLDHSEGDVYVLDNREDSVDYKSETFSFKGSGYLVFQGHREVAFNSDEVFRSEKAAYRGLEKVLNKKLRVLARIRNSLKFSESKVFLRFSKEVIDGSEGIESSL